MIHDFEDEISKVTSQELDNRTKYQHLRLELFSQEKNGSRRMRRSERNNTRSTNRNSILTAEPAPQRSLKSVEFNNDLKVLGGRGQNEEDLPVRFYKFSRKSQKQLQK